MFLFLFLVKINEFPFPEYPQGMCETMIMSQTAKNPESCKATKRILRRKKRRMPYIVVITNVMIIIRVFIKR